MARGVEERVITFDDVVILPGLSRLEPLEVDITGKASKSIAIHNPIVSSPMDTVTEWRMAVSLARLGAVGVIHRNMPREDQAEQVGLAKSSSPSPWSEIPKIDVEYDARNARFVLEEVGAGAAILVSKGGILGFFVLDRPDAGLWLEKARYTSLYISRIRPMPTIDGEGRVVVGAAISPFDVERAKSLEKAGADFLVVDVAHLHNSNALSALAKLVKEVSIDVVAGNLGTREGVLDTLSRVEEIGGVRVGISSGSICSTGEVAGAAVPTLTAVLNARSALEELGLHGRVPIVADGGVRNPGDIAKALVAGASSVMTGRMLAGTEEAAAPKIRVGDKVYKPYRGMASRGAMEKRYASDRYATRSKMVEEGVEGLVPYKGPVVKVLYEIAEGLKAALGYAGAVDIPTAWEGRLALVSPSGGKEVKPHDVILG
ncbi:MAG: IMP dehydrogenase [Aeropyrum sp.]|nr:IMP dehydrogenase [Aeropyrum sp.]